MNKPLVSIIIPARDAEDTIEKCINSILNIDFPNFEVIVVNDGSQDRTAEILKKYAPRIKLITNPSSLGPSKARNIASLQAEGDYLAFTDSDCIVDKDWLRQLLLGFTDTSIVSAGGRQEVPEDETEFGRLVSKLLNKIGFVSDYMRIIKANTVSVNHNPSCNVMYRKDVFLKESGFQPGLWPGEDVELDYRLKRKGYKIIFNPKAVVYHYRPKDLRSFLKMMYRYGWAQGFLVKRYGIFRKIQFLPLITSIFLLFILWLLVYNQLFTVIVIISFLTILLFYLNFNLLSLFLELLGFIYWHIGFIKGFILVKK